MVTEDDRPDIHISRKPGNSNADQGRIFSVGENSSPLENLPDGVLEELT